MSSTVVSVHSECGNDANNNDDSDDETRLGLLKVKTNVKSMLSSLRKSGHMNSIVEGGRKSPSPTASRRMGSALAVLLVGGTRVEKKGVLKVRGKYRMCRLEEGILSVCKFNARLQSQRGYACAD